MWGKVSCLRKQHDGRDWASNHPPSDRQSNALTTTPPRPRIHILLNRWNKNLIQQLEPMYYTQMEIGKKDLKGHCMVIFLFSCL